MMQALYLAIFLPNVDVVELLKVFGVAGLGGLSLGVFYLLFKELIRKIAFPKLDKDQAYKIIRYFMILVFLIAVLGIIVWSLSRESQIPGPVPPVTLHGWVVGSKNSEPLPKTMVGIHTGPSAPTNVNGDFELTGIPPRLQSPETAELYVTGWVILQPFMVSRGQFVVVNSSQQIKVVVAEPNQLLSAKAVETPVGQRVFCFDYRRKTQAACPHSNSPKQEWHSYLEQKAGEIHVPTKSLEDAVNMAVVSWMRDDSTPLQKGLAAIYRNDYGAAAPLFKSAMSSKDSAEAMQARISAAYSEYRAHNYVAAAELLDDLKARHLNTPVLKDAVEAVASNHSPENAPTISASTFLAQYEFPHAATLPTPTPTFTPTVTPTPVPVKPCDNADKNAHKTCLILLNILHKDRRLLDTSLSNAVDPKIADGMYARFSGLADCSNEVEIHKVRWRDTDPGYVAIGKCLGISPRLWMIFDGNGMITRLGNGYYLANASAEIFDSKAQFLAQALLKNNVPEFYEHFTPDLKTRYSVGTVSARVQQVAGDLGNLKSIAKGKKDQYSNTVQVRCFYDRVEIVLELEFDERFQIRDWYLRRSDEARYLIQEFKDAK